MQTIDGRPVSRLVFGGNVFGWTADEATSHAVLDAYVGAGGTMVDSADAYSHWVPGNVGGESERILGSWISARGGHDDLMIATKVAKLPGRPGLSPANVKLACDESLARLRTDVIDLYYAHEDDASVPVADIVGGFAELVAAGKVRYLGASNLAPARLAEFVDVAKAAGLPHVIAYQGDYSLVERGYEGEMRDVIAARGLDFLSYYSLARGFLTGKYRDGAQIDSPRASGAKQYMTDRGFAIVDAVVDIAQAHQVPPGTVALAWLAAQPTVTAPIASARNLDQWAELEPVMTLELSADEIARLDAVSA